MDSSGKLKTDIDRIIPNVKQQHRVWRYYLEKWSNEKKQIWCFDKEEIKTFLVATEKVAKEHYAYYQPLLTEDELYCFRKMLENQNDSVIKDLELILFPQKINQLMLNFKMHDLEDDLDYLQSNYLEQYHGFIEQMGRPYLDLFREMTELKSFPNEQDLYCFNYYLAIQWIRTTRIKPIIDSQKESNEIKTFTFEDGKQRTIRLWVFSYFTTYMLATKLAQTLSYEDYRYHILVSDDLDFFTSDQPVFNACKSYEIINDVSFQKEMNIVYSISPSRVLIINKQGENSIEKSDVFRTRTINDLIYEMSNRYIFASHKQQLNELNS